MFRRLMTTALLCSVAFWAAHSAAAQTDTKEAQNKLLAKRAAEADAYRKLAETIKGLQLTSETFVRDFVTESDVIQAQMDTFIKGVRLGEPRWYEDLSCEVPAEVTVAKLITELKSIHTRHYQGDRVKGTDFENIKQYLKKDIIKVVGMGAPRPELPPDLPAGVEEMLSEGVTLPEPKLPELWKQIGPQARLMAKRAAELDAMRRLLERIKGLRITSDTQVRDFVTEWDEIQAQAKGYLVGAYETGVYYHADEPIVEVTYAIPVEQVIEVIKKLHMRHYKGDRVKGADITNIKRNFVTKTFEATGMGVPPEKYMRRAASAPAVAIMPDWAGGKITATGQGTDAAMDTPQGRLKAARAAELDAKRRLAEQVGGLTIKSSTKVRDFVTEQDEIQAQMRSVLLGAMVENTEWGNGVAQVTVSVPGAAVWSIVHEQIRMQQR